MKRDWQDGIRFVREPRKEAYGTVALFEDLYGNLWDLLEPNDRIEAPDVLPDTRGKRR